MNVWVPSSRFLDQLVKQPTVLSVYGAPFSRLTAPNGYEFVMRADGTPEFRAPRVGDWYFAIANLGAYRCDLAGNNYDPRLLLRPKPKPRRWVFEETGETRSPRKGEWYRNISDDIECAEFNYGNAEFPILRLVERPDAD